MELDNIEDGYVSSEDDGHDDSDREAGFFLLLVDVTPFLRTCELWVPFANVVIT